ncbi:MAG: hydrogen gas-evolving membrane-bound hydrogenase subunit E [Pseudomonadota bacterium]
MNLSVYLLIGLLLALPLAWRSNKIIIAFLFAYWLLIFLWAIQVIHPFSYSPIIWSAQLGIQFDYHIDGLARLFSLLISGIGVLVFMYAVIYTQGDAGKRTKLLYLLQLFAISMLAIVLTNNTIVLFLAWELTTITSFLLIQFDVTDPKANQAAFNGMFISVLGGLAMLAGFILLRQQVGSWSIQSALHALQQGPHSLTAIFCLLVLGAVTKSAQFPFYFWLPGAMKAPTPVSAYLHSATMVNAGIYLLARFHPLFGTLSYWYPTLAFFGMSTMLIAGVLSLFQYDLKALLAYTTLFALGSMVYLLGSDQWLAAEAMAMFLLFHGLYKAAAFMWVGTIDKTYGSRDLLALRGLGRRWLPASLVAIVSLAAMAGLPPFFGFVVKEMLYEAKLASGSVSYVMMAISIFSSMLIAASSFKCLYYWFVGRTTLTKQKTLTFGLLCPLILVVFIICLNSLESYLRPFISAAADSIIWHPVNFESAYSGLSVALSLTTVLGGVLLFFVFHFFYNKAIHWPSVLNPLVLFEKGLAKFLYFGRWFTYITQRQALSTQLMLMFAALLIWLGFALVTNWSQWWMLNWQASSWALSVLSLLLIVSAISLLLSQRFLINMVSLALLGLIMSAIFVLQGAPDVAMTQLLVEILTVIILLVALHKARFPVMTLTVKQRGVHAVIATCVGIAVTLLLFAVVNKSFPTHLSDYFIQNSLPLAYGRNVVNVILVDFRAFDTFGEAIVILATALAIWLLIDKSASNKTRQRES